MSINNLNTYLNIKDSHLRVVSGNVYAQAMNIGGINVETAHGLQSVSNTGNVTSNTLQFSNAITGFVTTANAQIGRDLIVSGNTTVSTDLTVSANATVADTLTISEHLIASKEATVTGNLHVTTIRSDSNVVAEYTGPHDRPLRKYPEVAMTSASQGGYVVTQSGGTAYEAFDEDTSTRWYSGSDSHYDSAGGAAITDPTNANVAPRLDTNTDYGDWLAIEVPTGIKLESFKLMRYDGSFPSSGTLYAKNSSGDSWTEIYRYDGYTGPSTGAQQDWTHVFHVNSTVVYKNFAVVGRVREAGQQGSPGLSVKDWELYGYEEGSGSLDTTLKTVYNVPGTQQLDVYYDGQDYGPSVPTSITDKTGNGNNTTTVGSGIGFDSTYKAFTFNGTSNGKIVGTHDFTGDASPVLTMSFWMKRTAVVGSYDYIATIGTAATGQMIGLTTNPSNQFNFGNQGDGVITDESILLNQWYHVTLVANGGAALNSTNFKPYINGKEPELYSYGGDSTTNLTGSQVTLGTNSGGGQPFNGSIANFRLYSKALNADQIKELYDYQKDYFLGSKSQVTLYKGHLGVGVTEPSGQLELAGDERIQEYPPRAMTGYETLVEGHGVFCASASSENTNLVWEAFDKSNDNSRHYQHSSSSGGGYSDSDGSYGGSDVLSSSSGTPLGVHVILKIPYQIYLKQFSIQPRNNAGYLSEQTPKDGQVWGSNDGNSWYHLHSYMGLTFTSGTDTVHFNVNHTNAYSYYALIVTRSGGGTNAFQGFSIGELRYFGTPGPTTLDKGSLTLGRSLDVPRISRYDVDTETPRPEKLVVDFDTTVNNTPTDISGKGNHGAFKNDSEYSAADKAFKFAAANAHIYLEQGTISGTSASHTFSLWINALSGPGNGSYEAIFEGGVRSNNQAFGLYAYQDGSNTRVYYHVFGNNLPSNTAGYIVNTNSWYHICGTLDNSGNVRRFYVNGELFASDTYGSLNVTHPRIRIGENVNGSESWHGMVSNFKLYNVVLEPSEVQKLYRLGRTGRSMVISDTAVGIGKVPEAQLDVRGNLNVDGDIFLNGLKAFIPTASPITRAGIGVLLDASDPNSYPTSGNFFYDTSGNGRHGTIQGSVGWVSNGQSSYFNFPGANTDYIYQTSGSAFKFKDICIVFKFDNLDWNYLLSYSTNSDRSIRNYQGITYNNSSIGDWAWGSATTYYLNGVATTGNLTMAADEWYILGGAATNTVFVDNARSYYMGTGYGGRHLDGKIAFLALYDRVLTADEQLQNYIALKSRFGL